MPKSATNYFTESGVFNIVDGFMPASSHVAYVQVQATGRRHYSDPEILRRMGIIESADDPALQDWGALIIPEHRPMYQSVIEKARQEGGSHKVQYRVHGAQGGNVEVYDYFGITTVADGSQVMAGCVILNRNLYTKSQRTERLALFGRLVGGMIHDFKNVLGGIRNMLEWCIAQSTLEESVYEKLTKTIAHTDQANSLMTSTLQLIGGKPDETIEHFEVDRTIAELEELIRQIMSAGIAVEFEIGENLPPLMGHSSIFQDMLLNLCINARDAMKTKGSKLEVGAHRTTIKDDRGPPREYVCLRVWDDGCGMTATEVKSIFKPFYSTKDEGSGLGLWMVQEAAMAFDAQVNIESEKDVGTTFEILIPAFRGVAPVEAAKAEAGTPEGGPAIKPFDFATEKTILVIEDDPLLRNAISTWLKTLGFRVVLSEDGDQAWTEFQRSHGEIDLIIQDLILPGKRRGEKLLAEFVALKPDIPIIVASGAAELTEVDWVNDKGAFGYLAKPFKIETLIEMVRAALEGS